ncbi:MAG: C39 family peptidase [Ruminococcus sp.]|nr:C39 family peptidase [Ruminococcus sp.]
MLIKILKTTATAIIATILFTSCGNRVSIMNSSTEADAETISPDGSYVEIEEYKKQESIEPEKLIEKKITRKSAGQTTTQSTTQSTTQPETESTTINIQPVYDYELPRKAVIDDFKTVLQNPELPTGCEITALTQTLNFLGFDVDKVTMCDKYMNTDWKGEYTMNQCYIGDPKSSTGYGCSSPVICKSARRYFRVEKSDCYPVDLSGTDFQDLFYQVDQGRPVIVWATMYLMNTEPKYQYTAKNGEEMWFCTYQHCLTLYGYDLDAGLVYVADPLVGNTTYSLEKFEKIYDILGKQAVIIYGDAENGLNASPKPVTRSGEQTTTTEEETTTESTTEETTETTTEPETIPETVPETVPEQVTDPETVPVIAPETAVETPPENPPEVVTGPETQPETFAEPEPETEPQPEEEPAPEESDTEHQETEENND